MGEGDFSFLKLISALYVYVSGFHIKYIFKLCPGQESLENAILLTGRKTLCKEPGLLSKTEVQILAQTFTSCVTLGKLFAPSDLWLPHLKSRGKQR